jgi:hypothetical protein
MSHLDEGTIHAWLDGALPADEASRVEAHARECAQCAAMVAEARGFIAGASRIVSALDVVPGNVIPSAPMPTGASAAARNSVWKRLKLTPARAAIAATILVGVASMFSVRHRDFQSASPRDQITASTPPAVGERATTPSAAAVAGGAAAAPAPAGPASAAPVSVAVDTAVVPQREAKRAQAADTQRRAMASVGLSEARAKAAADSSARARLAEVTTNIAPQKAAANAAAAAAAGAPAPSPAASQPSAAQGRFARRVPVNAQPAAAASDRMIEPEGCYAIDEAADADLHGFPVRFELAHDSSNASVVRTVNADARVGRPVDGATWRMEPGNAVVVTLRSPPAGAALGLRFLLGDTALRVTDRGTERLLRLTRIDCDR